MKTTSSLFEQYTFQSPYTEDKWYCDAEYPGYAMHIKAAFKYGDYVESIIVLHDKIALNSEEYEVKEECGQYSYNIDAELVVADTLEQLIQDIQQLAAENKSKAHKALQEFKTAIKRIDGCNSMYSVRDEFKKAVFGSCDFLYCLESYCGLTKECETLDEHIVDRYMKGYVVFRLGGGESKMFSLNALTCANKVVLYDDKKLILTFGTSSISVSETSTPRDYYTLSHLLNV